jgi:nucleoid DNA-binding protein
MTKRDMANAIAQVAGVGQTRVQGIVKQVFDAIIDTLVQEGTIELRGFGIFKVKKRKARQARNPHNGEKVSVPEKFVVTFKAGQEVQEGLRQAKRMPSQK